MSQIYLATDAVVTGDVELGDQVNIWYGAVLRGDSGKIKVGGGTNIQERCILHEATSIGESCTIGHGAIVHGCTIGNHTMVGMGAIVLTGATIGDSCIIGAGAVVTGKTNAPPRSLLLGNPAKVVKEITQEQQEELEESARHYIALAKRGLPAVTEGER